MTHLRFDKLTNLPFEIPDAEPMKDLNKFHDSMKAGKDDTKFDRPAIDLQNALDKHAAAEAVPWDQTRINHWQDSVFGLVGIDPLADGGVMDKLEEEVGEVRAAIAAYQEDPCEPNFAKARREIADVQITLAHLGGVMGVGIQAEVNDKMDINVERKWSVNESGSGKHVR